MNTRNNADTPTGTEGKEALQNRYNEIEASLHSFLDKRAEEKDKSSAHGIATALIAAGMSKDLKTLKKQIDELTPVEERINNLNSRYHEIEASLHSFLNKRAEEKDKSSAHDIATALIAAGMYKDLNKINQKINKLTNTSNIGMFAKLNTSEINGNSLTPLQSSLLKGFGLKQ